MTEVEKILTGIANINDYSLENDFDNDEIEQLLEEGIIEATNISQWRASDLLIDGIIDYEQYPFENFSAYEQIRQLKHRTIAPNDFRKKADFDSFDADEWLSLLEVLPNAADNVPWADLKRDGSVKSWMDLLTERPQFAEIADWNLLAEKGKLEDFFDLLRHCPDLYRYFVNKEQLQQADSRLWVNLLARRPELAEFYPLDTLDEVDEIEFLLLHQPQLVSRISWNADNPPVKLYISNQKPEILTEIRPGMLWLISSDISNKLQTILKKILFYNPDDAKWQANEIGHSPETFAGIYSRQTAEHIMQEFDKAVVENQLDLLIRKEEIGYGD